MTDEIVIPRRFNGPPDSGNGGYTCGMVAGQIDAEAVEVSLRAPPPLDTPLAVERSAEGVLVHDGDTLVAEGRAVELELDLPDPVSAQAAETASRGGYEHWSSHHPFPTCIVCGPAREPGDGLRIFPGQVAGGDAFAAGWTPDPSLADDDGLVRRECVWAALDCPTSAPVANFAQGPAVVLARLAARVEAPVRAEEPHVLVSWPIAVDGRKRHAASAAFTASGELVARARALWIELRPG